MSTDHNELVREILRIVEENPNIPTSEIRNHTRKLTQKEHALFRYHIFHLANIGAIIIGNDRKCRLPGVPKKKA